MKKSIPIERIDPSLWAKDASDGLMFLGTSIMEEKECISKIKKGIELCDFFDKLDSVNENNKIPIIDIETFMTLKRIASNKSLHDYDVFREIKEKRKEIKNALIEIIENPRQRDAKLDEYELIFSQLARIFFVTSS